MADADNDNWRLTNQDAYLHGVRWQYRTERGPFWP